MIFSFFLAHSTLDQIIYRKEKSGAPTVSEVSLITGYWLTISAWSSHVLLAAIAIFFGVALG